MKKMTRRWFLAKAGLTAVGLAALALGAGCGATPTPKPTEKPVQPAATAEKPATAAPAATQKATEKPVTAAPTARKAAAIRYSSSFGPFNLGCFPQVSKEFQQKFPNINVTLEEVASGEAVQKYTAMFLAGTAPDVIYQSQAQVFFDKGYILDQAERLKIDGFDFNGDFYHGVGFETWRGKLYGFPFMFETCLLLYNKDMVKKYWGKDLWEAFPDGMWDEADMLEVARACAQDLNKDGKIDQWGLYMYHSDYWYAYETTGWTRGDNIYDVKNVKFNFTTPTIRQMTHDILSWVKKDKFAMSMGDFAEVNKAASVTAPFFAGVVALYHRMSPDVGRGLTSIGDKFQWDLMYLPNYKGNLAITRAGGQAHSIYAKSPYPDEAYEWCKWTGTSPGQRYMAMTKSAIPVYRKDPELRKLFETGTPKHDNVIMGVLEDRGGYSDHLRFYNETECRTLFTKQADLLYAASYEEANAKLDDTLAKVQKDMNDLVDYGGQPPFPDFVFPFKPPKK